MPAKLLAHGDTPLLQLKTQDLLDEFGAGRHKPGSGSAAALLGLLSCKMMHTVIKVTKRNLVSREIFSHLEYIERLLLEKDEPFFRDAVQRDADQFDRYFLANERRRNAKSDSMRRKWRDRARTELMPATEIPLEIASRAAETVERGMLVFDLGAKHARGDSGVAISTALSSCSGALFIVYLNLKDFREGQWALGIRQRADSLTERFNLLQSEQFNRVTKLQAEGLEDPQLELNFGQEPKEELGWT